MGIGMIYAAPCGRLAVTAMRKAGLFRLGSRFLRSPLSRAMIPGYIQRNGIDMRAFEGQSYRTFAEFFARRRAAAPCCAGPRELISPCDGLLSVYDITADMNIPMKGSRYRLCDLVPDEAAAEGLAGGLCLVFRLRASDYHHFCAFDDAVLSPPQYIPGELHSVQPIACGKVPVYRLNRRWWSVLDTACFGTAVQVEVGAMMVGGVAFEKPSGSLRRGEEMGHFELAGSTIVLLLPAAARRRLSIYGRFQSACGGAAESPVLMGESIGVLRDGPEPDIG